MAHIYPFKAFRPVNTLVDKIASYPYDVVNSEEARELAKGNQYSFFRVVKSEVDLDSSIDLYSSDVYKKAAENLKDFIEKGWLKPDDKPSMFVYTQKMGDHLQKGLVACCDIDDYVNNVIKKHELTRADKEKDRMVHIKTTNANTGPVFLTYPAQESIDKIINEQMKKDPVYDFVAADGIRHTVYTIVDSEVIERLVKIFEGIKYLYIADGHHRSASTVKVGLEKKSANPNHTGNEEYNRFLAVMFPHNQLKVLDYNRVVKDLNGSTPEEFFKKIEVKFTIEKKDSVYKPEKLHTFGMYINQSWYKLTPKEASFNDKDIMSSLDVSILQDNLLNPILNIDDPRTNSRINFVGGIRGLGELEKLVNSGKFAVAFAVFPVSVEELMAIADAGKIMPPKSTWFEPKLRSGLFVHMLD